MSESQSGKPFELGLVMAGAVSAGAYTAGVVDFLIQALNEWEKARKQDPSNVPGHEVRLKIIAGSSAGGMTGAVMTAMLNEPFHPVTTLPEHEPGPTEIARNKLYNAWVQQIDIRSLLDISDLKEKQSRVVSLLDSSILEIIADQALTFVPSNEKPAWLSDSLHLFLTLTNLQGIPYDIRFRGTTGKDDYIVEEHGDYMHFEMSSQKPGDEHLNWLNPGNASDPNWSILKQAALATGAFPVGLAPRFMSRPFYDYENRTQKIPQSPEGSEGVFECSKTMTIQPDWPEHHTKNYQFAAVDGGFIDNEPFDLAHDFLAGEQGYNERNPEQVRRSTLMIDPFPNTTKNPFITAADFKNYGIMNVLWKLFGSLIDQARFKPGELILATSGDVYSRFLIAPTRRTEDGILARYPMASGSLGGFGGFLSKRFRMHDFQLGRRNCQQFLRRHFVLPVDKARLNPVFARYSDSDFIRFANIFDDGAYLPIIPLMGSARDTIGPVAWDSIKMNPEDLREIKSLVRRRTKVVINRLLEQYIDHSLARTIARTAIWVRRKNMINAMMKMITDELHEFDLLKS